MVLLKCSNTQQGGARASDRRPPALPEPEIHRVDPESGSTQEALIGIFSQTVGSTCKFWVEPVNFTLSEFAELS